MRVDYESGEYIITGKCKCGNMTIEFLDEEVKRCICCERGVENGKGKK